ncbi:CubicO group peptidase, beta-lactamase class C family [Aquiflexum balticum DSM 16537]|uniref:CubicO group peptidase, beta-lactamase class C family n=1 Tax=Aquiflexum balticum DSM 16537 TaxID=758820 RepID=A0A1W2H4B2_9BACT|nr:serine hydrolase domain-containing protein [Aquiflexum balticum]SMD43790.1 CubicO group peptidase, beta-lactamase class C family [Aquiflexum balticum DSM 16537]
MNKYLLFTLTFAILTACSQKPHPIAEIFKDYQGENPGAAVAIIQDGDIVYHQSYGMAEMESKRPVQSNTNFRLASVTKQFTATAILLLEEKGLIDLNWTLDQVFEDFPEYGQNIQIHHLLNHTSGIWDYEDFVPDSALVNPVMDQGVLEIIQNTDQTYFPAGEQFRYSNTAFALLALMVEKYSGQDFPEFLEENIFKPLDMNTTVAHIKNQNTVPERAYGYTKENGQWIRKDQSSTSAVLGDGGIYSNVLDLFKWDQALYNGTILPKSTKEKTFTNGLLNDGSLIDYGLAWHIKEYKGEKVVYHTGSTTSFRNIFYRIPSRNLSIIILTNRNLPEEESMVDLAERIIEVFQNN